MLKRKMFIDQIKPHWTDTVGIAPTPPFIVRFPDTAKHAHAPMLIYLIISILRIH